MERLSKVHEDDWNDKRKEFVEWCQEAIEEIDGIAKETSDGMVEKMRKRIAMVEQRAIEAADEAEE